MKISPCDLENRLIDFSVSVISFIDHLPSTKTAVYLGSQLVRSATSPSLNYGEAKSAESRSNFFHKMKICLKELGESYNCLRILYRTKLFSSETQISSLLTECNELISILSNL